MCCVVIHIFWLTDGHCFNLRLAHSVKKMLSKQYHFTYHIYALFNVVQRTFINKGTMSKTLGRQS